jgi:phage gp29-like protein
VGLAHWLYWPTFFKRHDLKFWLVFLEKFGMPTAHGTYPRGAHESEQTKLLEALAAIQTDSGVITPEGMKITLLEAARSGSNTYEAMANKMDAAIAKVVLSQTMTTDSGSSRSQAEVHQGVALWVIKSDADLVCQSFNRSVVRWLTDWNFPGARAPQVWRRVTPPADLESHARRDKLIFDMGYRPTARHIADTYGGDWVPALLTNPEKSEFSEPAVAELEEAALLEKTAEQGDPVLSRWIERVRELLQEAASLEDFRDKLLTLVPDLSPTTLGEVMEQALGVANLMGRAEIQDGR